MSGLSKNGSERGIVITDNPLMFLPAPSSGHPKVMIALLCFVLISIFLHAKLTKLTSKGGSWRIHIRWTHFALTSYILTLLFQNFIRADPILSINLIHLPYQFICQLILINHLVYKMSNINNWPSKYIYIYFLNSSSTLCNYTRVNSVYLEEWEFAAKLKETLWNAHNCCSDHF